MPWSHSTHGGYETTYCQTPNRVRIVRDILEKLHPAPLASPQLHSQPKGSLHLDQSVGILCAARNHGNDGSLHMPPRREIRPVLRKVSFGLTSGQDATYTRGHFERTHGDVLNAHTEGLSLSSLFPPFSLSLSLSSFFSLSLPLFLSSFIFRCVVADSSNHSLYLIELLNFSYLE